MKALKSILIAPMRFLTVFMRITGRIVAGVVGFLLMGAGLFLIEPLNLPVLGVPLLVVGLLLTLRAVF